MRISGGAIRLARAESSGFSTPHWWLGIRRAGPFCRLASYFLLEFYTAGGLSRRCDFRECIRVAPAATFLGWASIGSTALRVPLPHLACPTRFRSVLGEVVPGGAFVWPIGRSGPLSSMRRDCAVFFASIFSGVRGRQQVTSQAPCLVPVWSALCLLFPRLPRSRPSRASARSAFCFSSRDQPAPSFFG